MHSTVLPVREPPWPDESLTGFVRRHVLAMGYESFARLLSIVEGIRFPRHLENLRSGSSLTALAKLLRREPEELVAKTIHREPEHEWNGRMRRNFGASSLFSLAASFDPSRRRVCLVCLRERPEHERLSWLFRPLDVCPEHGTLLVDQCPTCGRAFSAYRLELLHCRCGATMSGSATEPVGPTALEKVRTIRGWFDGRRPESLNVAGGLYFRWLARLQAAVSKTPTWLARTRLELRLPSRVREESVAGLAAADLVSKWPKCISEFLDEFQESENSAQPSTRIGRAFSRLLGDAERLEQDGCDLPAETLREYLLTRYTRGHLSGKGSLFRDVRQRERIAERPWISQTSAARMLKLRPPSVGELVRRKVLEGRIRVSGRRGRTNGVVRRESVVEYGRRLAAALSVAQAAERLGTATPRILDLIRADVLKDAVRGPLGWRIPVDVVNGFEDRLRQLPQTAERNRIPLHEALRRFGVGGMSFARLLQSFVNGDLDVGRAGEGTTLRDLRFEPTALLRLARTWKAEAAADTGYSLSQLGKSLYLGRSLRPTVLRKWIAAGLLQATRNRKSWHVPAAEVARFRATYCLAREVCAVLGIARSTLDVWQRRRRLVPVYSRLTHPGAGTPVYLRADVERFAATLAA